MEVQRPTLALQRQMRPQQPVNTYGMRMAVEVVSLGISISSPSIQYHYSLSIGLLVITLWMDSISILRSTLDITRTLSISSTLCAQTLPAIPTTNMSLLVHHSAPYQSQTWALSSRAFSLTTSGFSSTTTTTIPV